MEAREAGAIVSSGCNPTLAELDAMPQSKVERLVAMRDVLKVIEFGLEM